MEAKAYLEQVERLDLMIATAQRKVNKLKATATSTSASMSGERVASSGSKGKMADAVIQYTDIEREEILPLKRKKEDILRNLQKLKGRVEFLVLYEHYFNKKQFKIIALETRLSYSHIIRSHNCGLAQLQKIIGE